MQVLYYMVRFCGSSIFFYPSRFLGNVSWYGIVSLAPSCPSKTYRIPLQFDCSQLG